MSRQTTQSQLTLNLERKTAEPPMMPGSRELREALADLLLAALNLQEEQLDRKESGHDA